MRNTIFGLKKPDPAFSFKAGRHSGYRYLMNALILISLLQLNTTATAQKISLSESNISVEKVVKTLKAKTGYDFFM